MDQISQVERLRSIQADMQRLYEDAKEENVPALMDRFSKTIMTLSKQIKEQELHDRETVYRKDAIRAVREAHTFFCRAAKEKYGPECIPDLLSMADQAAAMADAELLR